MEGYCDSDYASDISSRRSTTGFVYILNDSAVSCNSKLQKTVAASTSEAEYMAASHAVRTEKQGRRSCRAQTSSLENQEKASKATGCSRNLPPHAFLSAQQTFGTLKSTSNLLLA